MDIHLSVPENSHRAQLIQSIAEQHHITADQAVERVFEAGLSLHDTRNPAQHMWGAFSGEENAAMLDNIVEEAYALRLADQPRDFGI